MRSLRTILTWSAYLAVISGCTSVEPVPGDLGENTSAFTTGTIQLNLLYIHGVKNDASSRSNAQNSLTDLKAAVANDMPSLISTSQANHPGVTVKFASASANLYPATPSGMHPSDSTDPTL